MKSSYLNPPEAICYGPIIRAKNGSGARAIRANLKLPPTITIAEVEVFSELLDSQTSAANDN